MQPFLSAAFMSMLSLHLVACGRDTADRYEVEEPGDCSDDADNPRVRVQEIRIVRR
jgi:hypothetical protein